MTKETVRGKKRNYRNWPLCHPQADRVLSGIMYDGRHKSSTHRQHTKTDPLQPQHFFLSLRDQIGRKGASIVVEKRKKSRQCWWFICVRLYVVAAIDMAGPLAAAEKEIGGYLLLVSPCKSIWCETHTC